MNESTEGWALLSTEALQQRRDQAAQDEATAQKALADAQRRKCAAEQLLAARSTTVRRDASKLRW